MSVKYGLLALLSEQPRHGYELRAEFERRTGSTLNVGQVYTTLARLERDGRVIATGGGEAGQNTYAVTGPGRAELHEWFRTPVARESRPRDELAIKLALAVGAPEVDIRAVLQAQRTDSMRALQDYTRLKARADSQQDLAWLLVLDALVFQTEAELRWLDHCEARLARAKAATVHPNDQPSPARQSAIREATAREATAREATAREATARETTARETVTR